MLKTESGLLTMAKYVNLDKIISKLEKAIEEHKADISEENAITAWIFKRFIAELEKVPTADVAEVVRCKDCKHYDKKYHQCKLHSEEPDQYHTGFIFCMQEDDFCSYGERKE